MQCLYPLQSNVVLLVAGVSLTVDQAAEMIYGRMPSRAMREEIGRQLRYGLGRLAEQWWGLPMRERRIDVPNAWRAPNLQAVVEAGTINPGRVVHASGRAVKSS